MDTRVTLADVAAHAGVSRSTASLVLRDSGSLAQSTRERVRASMNVLGYIYHRGAASLRSKSTQSVGLLVSDMSNGFTAELAVGLESALGEAGIVTLTANTLESPERQDLLVRSMLERQVDGLLVIPAIGSKAGFAQTLRSCGVPVVMASRELPRHDLTYVGIDNFKGGYLAAQHLVREHGARKIAFLGGFAELGPRGERVRGTRQVLEESGVAADLVVDIPGPPNGAFGLETARRLIDEGVSLDGIICHNDQVAFGVYRALRELQPPTYQAADVVSFDDVAEAALWEPPLTTVAANGHEVGARCADILIRQVTDPGAPVERTLITPHLVIRNSCGCRGGAS